MAINNPQWEEAVKAIQSANSILVVAHVSPDGDAIGSLLGLTEALKEMGKQVTGAIDEGVPAYLKFVPASDTILPELSSGEWDLMISTDSSDARRIGQVGEFGLSHSEKVINLDHHPTNTEFGDIHLIVADAVSAAEIVFDLLKYMKHDISVAVAYPLLTGLVTDTLGFRTSNTNPRTLAIAQALMERGAPLHTIMTLSLINKSDEELELWKLALPSVENDNGVISANVTLQNVRDAGMTEVKDAGLVGFLVNIDSARVSIVFKEQPDNEVEISFRSKVGYDVSKLAFDLGGGGHKQASGTTIKGTLQEVRNRVLPLARQVVLQGSSELA